MKRLALLLIATIPSLAGSLDGTRGNITLKLTSSEISTTVDISSTDSTYTNFVVLVGYKESATDMAAHVITQVARTFIGGRDNKPVAKAFLPFPEDHILWLSVTEVQPGQTQQFIPTKE